MNIVLMVLMGIGIAALWSLPWVLMWRAARRPIKASPAAGLPPTTSEPPRTIPARPPTPPTFKPRPRVDPADVPSSVEAAIAEYGYMSVMHACSTMWRTAEPDRAQSVGPAYSELTTCGCDSSSDCPWCTGTGWVPWHVAWVKSEDSTREAEDRSFLQHADFCTECHAPIRRFEDSSGKSGVMSIAESRVRGLQARVGELEEALSRIDTLLKMPERRESFGVVLGELIRRRIAQVVDRYRRRTSGQALLRLQRLQEQVVNTRSSAEQLLGEVRCSHCGNENLGDTVVVCPECAGRLRTLSDAAATAAGQHTHTWHISPDPTALECLCGAFQPVRLGKGLACTVCGGVGGHRTHCWAWKRYAFLRHPHLDPWCQQHLDQFGVHLTPCRCGTGTLPEKQEDTSHGSNTDPAS